MTANNVFGAELTDSLATLRELIGRETLTRSEAEAWVRVELFVMTALNYIERSPEVADLVSKNIAFTMAAYLPNPNPLALT